MLTRTTYSRHFPLLFTALVFFFHESHIFAQAAEERAARAVIAAGGSVHRDNEDRVDMVFLGTKGPFAFPIHDEDVESIDISVFSRLKVLSIVSSKMTDRSIVHLRKIEVELEWLDLTGPTITEKEIAALLRKQPSLVSLTLFETSVTDRALEDIGRLRKMRSVALGGTKISDKGLKHLAPLEKLLVLNLARTDISDAGMRDLCRMRNLSYLDLDGTKVTDTGIQQLGALKSLRTLSVSSTKVTEDGKRALQNLLPNLKFVK